MSEKWFGLLGLAQKAGKIVSGENAVLSVVNKRKAGLLVVASDSTARVKKIFMDLSNSTGVPLLVLSSKELLGKALGKPPRAVAAVLDKSLSEKIMQSAGEHKTKG